MIAGVVTSLTLLRGLLGAVGFGLSNEEFQNISKIISLFCLSLAELFLSLIPPYSFVVVVWVIFKANRKLGIDFS